MVEPLHIADYYRDGGKNYTTDGKRPKHFILLEEWYKQEQEREEKKKKEQEEKKQEKQKQGEKQKQEEKAEASPMKSKRENVSSSLNDDSCFWAHVEEALILLKNGVLTPDDKRKLKEFENYVWNALKNYAVSVSPEIFLEKSSFMKWWTVYKEIIAESFYPSLFADFMNCQSYHQYEEGVWCPPDFESNENREIGDKWKMRIHGLEWANLLVNSDLVHQAWGAIEEQKEINPNSELSLYNEIQQSNFTIIAFGTPRGSLQGKGGLISSSTLKEEDFSHFEFLCNECNSWFSINEAAISIFRSNYSSIF